MQKFHDSWSQYERYGITLYMYTKIWNFLYTKHVHTYGVKTP